MSTQWVDSATIQQVRRILLRLHRRQRVYILLNDAGWRII